LPFRYIYIDVFLCICLCYLHCKSRFTLKRWKVDCQKQYVLNCAFNILF